MIKLINYRLAQKYLENHEWRVSKTHLYKEEIAKRWKALKRWVENIKMYLIPWEGKIKRIESKLHFIIISIAMCICAIEGHFGSVVSSYFTFLRWIVWMNVIITLLMATFVVIPEVNGIRQKLLKKRFIFCANKTFSICRSYRICRPIWRDRIAPIAENVCQSIRWIAPMNYKLYGHSM